MKKNFLFFILIFSFISNAQSERKFYVKLKGGYNFSSSSGSYTVLDMNYNSQQINTSIEERTVANVGLGKGINTGLSIGYTFNKYLGAELAFDYLLGGKSSVRHQTLVGIYDETTINAKMFTINPSIVFRGGFTKINPYMKIGFITGKATLYQDWDLLGLAGNPTSKLDMSKEYSGNMAWGYNGSIGINYSITSKIDLFSELTLNKISYSPTKSSITKYIIDGEDILPKLTTESRETEYETNYSYDYSVPNSIRNLSPRKGIAFQTDLSSIAINLGVKYNF